MVCNTTLNLYSCKIPLHRQLISAVLFSYTTQAGAHPSFLKSRSNHLVLCTIPKKHLYLGTTMPFMKLDMCAPNYVLNLVGRKWVYLILRHLRKPARFRDLENYLPTITNHMLSEELKRLEREELIVHANAFYSLTIAGQELLDAIACLITWANKHKGYSLCPPNQSCANCARYQEDFSRN